MRSSKDLSECDDMIVKVVASINRAMDKNNAE